MPLLLEVDLSEARGMVVAALSLLERVLAGVPGLVPLPLEVDLSKALGTVVVALPL
ncbi:hypothetical protein [Luteolibacter soli]|uniref:Uncharacterized protein n=1 Tax=Luteolibacter soli TaxID=3135280 RepID=A0ABU9ANS2_9BACT